MAAVSRQQLTYSRERQDILARPKKIPPAFLQDRRSVYWVDKEPATGPTKLALTKRQEELVRHKTDHPAYLPDRFTPRWPISLPATRAISSKRICQLAKHKPSHPDWTAMRPCTTRISLRALHAVASERLVKLAQPKTYEPLPIKSDNEWDWSEWASAIPKVVKSYVLSARLEQLAQPRSCPDGYLYNRPIVWPVARTALQMQATARLHQLARPKIRQALDDDYDPCKVSLAARMAVPSQRVEDLAVPIPRKVRNKKTA